MNRRNFFARSAAVVAGLLAYRLLPEAPALAVRAGSGTIMSPPDLRSSLGKMLARRQMALDLQRFDSAFHGRVYDTIPGSKLVVAFTTPFNRERLKDQGYVYMVLRQVRYQAVKCSDSILIGRRGYEECISNSGQVYYRHLVTGQVRRSMPPKVIA